MAYECIYFTTLLFSKDSFAAKMHISTLQKNLTVQPGAAT